jgi:hypothetical protein
MAYVCGDRLNVALICLTQSKFHYVINARYLDLASCVKILFLFSKNLCFRKGDFKWS